MTHITSFQMKHSIMKKKTLSGVSSKKVTGLRTQLEFIEFFLIIYFWGD